MACTKAAVVDVMPLIHIFLPIGGRVRRTPGERRKKRIAKQIYEYISFIYM
jgi:hypothetical protein